MTIPIPERALTLKGLWPNLILGGGKRCENRSWPVPRTIQMPAWIALHHGVGTDLDGADWICDQQEAGHNTPMASSPRGCIVAVMQITACQDLTTEAYNGPGDHIYACGPFAWHIGAVIALPRPIRIRGFQGLWTLTDVVRGEIARQLTEVQP